MDIAAAGTETVTYFCGHIFCVKVANSKMSFVLFVVLPHRQIKYPVDSDDELKIGDVRYDKMT